MSTAANHAKRSHRSQRLHDSGAGNRRRRIETKQLEGAPILNAWLRRLRSKILPQQEKANAERGGEDE